MQPLISPVDHESRHNSYRVEDDHQSERTPLLSGRFPPLSPERNAATTAVVSLLLVILLAGVVIGIYLLVQQSHADNILPPVQMALQLVSRSQWDHVNGTHALGLPPRRALHVIMTQTDSNTCWTAKSCASLLMDMQNKREPGVVKSNFLVSSNGLTFEALGWRRASPLYPQYGNTSLVLAFIGNFTEYSPTESQMNEAQQLLDESVSQQYLDPHYDVITKNSKYVPKHLCSTVKKLIQWNMQLSDRCED